MPSLASRIAKHKAALVACSAAVLASIGSLFVGDASLIRLAELRAQLVESEHEVFAQQADNAEKRAYIRSLQTDLPTIERVAREQLGMIHPGEVTYIEVRDGAASPALRR